MIVRVRKKLAVHVLFWGKQRDKELQPPFPPWSPEGPVLEDDVLPLCRVQSNLSFLSCTKPHIDWSKSQEVAIRKDKMEEKYNSHDLVLRLGKTWLKNEYNYPLNILLHEGESFVH